VASNSETVNGTAFCPIEESQRRVEVLVDGEWLCGTLASAMMFAFVVSVEFADDRDPVRIVLPRDIRFPSSEVPPPLAARFAALPEALQEYAVGTEGGIVLGNENSGTAYYWTKNWLVIVVIGGKDVSLGIAETGLDAAELIARHMKEAAE
jgi:hypothetical protein